MVISRWVQYPVGPSLRLWNDKLVNPNHEESLDGISLHSYSYLFSIITSTNNVLSLKKLSFGCGCTDSLSACFFVNPAIRATPPLSGVVLRAEQGRRDHRSPIPLPRGINYLIGLQIGYSSNHPQLMRGTLSSIYPSHSGLEDSRCCFRDQHLLSMDIP